MSEEKKVLVTLERYDTFSAWDQGYVSYMEAAWPGSEIPDTNPYPVGSPEYDEWKLGRWAAYMETLELDG